MRKRLKAAVVLVGVVTMLTACSSTPSGVATAPVASGGTTADPSPAGSNLVPESETSSAGTAASSADGGDPGTGFNYPSTPATLPPTVSTQGQGRIVEGVRLSEYVIVPTLVLPDYTESKNFSTYVLKDGESTGNVLPTGVPEIATEFNMISGFSTARGTKNDSVGRSRELINAVMIFESPEDALAAAKSMNDVVGAVKDGPDTIAIPGVEGDLVATAVSGLNSGQSQLFVARGSLVIYVLTSTKGDTVEAMAQVIATVLKAQFRVSDTFVPTPLDQLSRLPVDREGMLAHTLLSPEGLVNVNKVYGIKGFKHFFANPLEDEQAIRSAGVDLVANGLTTVYRAKDAAGALLVADADWKQYPGLMGESAEYQSKADVADVRCLQAADSIRCVFTNGRYLIEAGSSADNPEPDVDAIVSAQDAILTGF